MRQYRLVAGLAGLLACAPALAAANEPAVVLVTDDLPELHRIQGEKGSRYHVEVPYWSMPQGYSNAEILGGALGGALAASIVEREMAIQAQRETNKTLAPVTGPLGDRGLQALLRGSFSRALAGHGMDQRALAFFAETKPDPKLLMRLKAASQARRFVLVGNGNAAAGPINLPLSLDPSLRQLRLALDIELREGKRERNRRLARRDVVVYSTPLDLAEGEEPLQQLAADDHARLRAAIDETVSIAFDLALGDRELPGKVDRDAEVGVAGPTGLVEFKAVVVGQADGRALLWTRDDSLVSIPTDEVLTGEALVVARADEQARKAAEAEALAKDGEADQAGKAGKALDGAKAVDADELADASEAADASKVADAGGDAGAAQAAETAGAPGAAGATEAAPAEGSGSE